MIDFLVIGGGIAGTSAAAGIAQLGKTVVLEAETALGFHASGRSAAMFEESYGKPAVTALTRASRDYMQAENLLSDRGLLMVARDADAAFKADVKTMGLDTITMGEARAMIPVLSAELTNAAYHADAWDIDTDQLLQGFVRTARKHGATFVTSAPVTSIQRNANGWAVVANGQTYHAHTLLNAAGAWSDLIAKLSGIKQLGLTPYRRSMARIAAPLAHDVTRWPMLFGPGETWYAKPDAGALIVSPADEDPTSPHDAYADDITLAEGLARYQDHVTTPITRMLANWAGLRTFAPDRVLVLGRDAVDAQFIWVAGQGGYGMQTAPAASRLIADICAERTPAIGVKTTADLCPSRFS